MTISDLYRQTWPADKPKATIVYFHGYPEHLGRHESTIRFLQKAGYTVYGFDQRWHGRSPGRKGYCNVARIIGEAVEQTIFVKNQEPDLPLVTFGHSMGALLATGAGLKRPDIVDAAVFSAAGFLPFPVMPWWMKELIAVGANLFPHLPSTKMNTTGVAYDRDVVDKLNNDPLYYHGRIPLIAAGTLVQQGDTVLHRCRDYSIPTFLLHAIDDPIADIQGSRKFAAEAGLNLPLDQRPEMTLVEVENTLHEVLHEQGNELYHQMIVDWLDDRFAPQA